MLSHGGGLHPNQGDTISFVSAVVGPTFLEL